MDNTEEVTEAIGDTGRALEADAVEEVLVLVVDTETAVTEIEGDGEEEECATREAPF